jgi:hypothetical protein
MSLGSIVEIGDTRNRREVSQHLLTTTTTYSVERKCKIILCAMNGSPVLMLIIKYCDLTQRISIIEESAVAARFSALKVMIPLHGQLSFVIDARSRFMALYIRQNSLLCSHLKSPTW